MQFITDLYNNLLRKAFCEEKHSVKKSMIATWQREIDKISDKDVKELSFCEDIMQSKENIKYYKG